MTEKVSADMKAICGVINNTLEAEKIYLFGSYAYGEPNADSDYDLCVVIPDNTGRPLDAAKQINRALYQSLPLPVDVIVYEAGSFERRRHAPTLERKISREGVLLHERQQLEQRMV